MFVSKTDPQGVLYHVYPIDDLKGEDARMEFDLTRHSAWDHYVVRFSLTEKDRSEVDSLRLVCGSASVSAPVKRLFVERKGGRWHQRFEAEVDQQHMMAWTNCPGDPDLPMIDVGLRRFRPSKNGWRTLSGKLHVIIELIELNKGG